jgi:hypothetical protein
MRLSRDEIGQMSWTCRLALGRFPRLLTIVPPDAARYAHVMCASAARVYLATDAALDRPVASPESLSVSYLRNLS